MYRLYTYATTPLLTILSATSSMAQPQGGRGWWGIPGWGHGMFGGVGLIVILVGIILLIVLLVRSFGGSSKSGSLNAHLRATPLDTLKERFAKGEIDKKEYEERRKLLSD
jgi:putative membrane protein